MSNSAIKNSREKETQHLMVVEPSLNIQKKNKIKKTKNIMIEEYLNEHYHFRYNILKSRAEYLNNETYEYLPVDKYVLNSLRRELDAFGLSTNIENINSIITSSYVKRVNPIQEYFRSLSKVDPNHTPYINELTQTVIAKDSDIWSNYFKKWIVAVVANAMNDEGCQNHTCLVLTGKQGAFKTTWLNYLCPKSLSRYLYTGKIDPQNKDTLTYISEYLFLNIDDQLKELNKKDENELKSLITAPFVKYRRPYATFIEEYPHLASFMASINGSEFLTDSTGSRRFLPFIVDAIDIEKQRAINMDNVFAEAMALYENGFQYWFNDIEINHLNTYSTEFQIQTNEYEMIAKYFEKPGKGNNSFMTTTEIQCFIRSATNINSSSKKIGEALKKLGFIRVSRRINGNPIYGYAISIKE